MSAKSRHFFIIILELIEIKYKIKGRLNLLANSNDINMEVIGRI